MIRELQSNLVGQLVCVPGIITSTSRTAIRSRRAVFTCTNCGHEKVMEVEFGLSKVSPPMICENQKRPGEEKTRCPQNCYEMNYSKSVFFDQQILKL